MWIIFGASPKVYYVHPNSGSSGTFTANPDYPKSYLNAISRPGPRLVSIGLECLAERDTQKFREGDITYTLMGLLRQRPITNGKGSSFEAIARLLLASANDALLERLICMQPLRRNAQWYEIEDAFGVRLWDIEPRSQVAGIIDDQAVTSDGAVGALI
ncbi:hypothetical protein F4814DRAFT_453296 [Daldinia grandis]|nr:hypothetical protein F4814DRAFT_453296 [Daldinia grandis]